MIEKPLGERYLPRLRFSRAMRTFAPLLALCCLPVELSAESGNRVTSPPRIDPPAVPERIHFPTIVIRRDPFAASPDALATESSTGDGSDAASLVLPPNAAIAAPVVRAVILGDDPKALVDLAGRPLVVGIGTPLADSTVVAITRTAVVLQDGERLRMTGWHP
jgi:hypothetical protein